MGARPRRAWLLVAVMLVGCSGGTGLGGLGGGTARTLKRAVELSESTAKLADDLTDQFGVVPGARALILSLDGGFSIQQIADAILDGRLLPDGLIEAIGEGLEPPDGDALRHFVLGVGFRAPPPNPALDEFIDDLVASAIDPNDDILAIASDAMLRLEVWGYPLEQVLEHIPGGYTAEDEESGATVMFDEDGTYVCPDKLEGEIDCGELQEDLEDLARDILPDEVFDGDGDDDTVPETAGDDDEVCVDGSVAFVEEIEEEDAEVTTSTLRLCFPEDGGPTSGRAELALRLADEDCVGTVSVDAELSGDYAPPEVSGEAEMTFVIALDGECTDERIFDISGTSTDTGTWAATWNGESLVGSVATSDGASVLFLTGGRS